MIGSSRATRRGSIRFRVILAAAIGGLFLGGLVLAGSAKCDETAVRLSEQPMVIPTYPTGPADPYPMFYMNESYQGAQKRVYPYALQDHLIHDRQDQTYTSLWLENEYVQLCVLPELGARLFAATDKTNGYDFFYRQHVIKPALIGMLGAWISGGVEWCAFHHHRNTTFMPVDYAAVDNSDGSKTIWFGETERRHRMRWLIGLTLFPDRSYVEATIKFFNRTAQPHSILYWANVAVHVDDQYQVIFPPSVQVATYHSKIDFTHWPIAQGPFRGYDYSGTDISWWKNSPVSNSFFAWDLNEDFMGGYDHGRQAGVVHIGNHHIVCGAKLWEWGTGTVGRAWDKILTDEDGPYAELMVGAFSDNQPDYSWIMPHEVKVFRQYWYPIRDIGGVKNANLDAAVNLEIREQDQAFVGFHTTAHLVDAQVEVTCGGRLLLSQTIDIAPDQPFTSEVALPEGTSETELRAVLRSSTGQELIAYQPITREPVDQLPEPVKAPARPEEIESQEQLYLTGLRIEQIHNPRVDPMDYYLDALRRDPGDSRCNLMAGITYHRRGMYVEAEEHLRRAVQRLTQEYTRSRTGEAHFHLGMALLGQQRDDEAYDQFYRATWDQALSSAAYYQLACVACRRGELGTALEHVSHSLQTNTSDAKAYNLGAAVLRRLGQADDSDAIAARVRDIDPLDFWSRNETYLNARDRGDIEQADRALQDLMRLMRDDPQAYLELATDYLHAGLDDEAIEVLRRVADASDSEAGSYPLIHYYLGYLCHRGGRAEDAKRWLARGSQLPVDYCFPFRLETADVLAVALEVQPGDARAEYYLGNLFFDHQPDRAMRHWERSRELDSSVPVVHRNLGWAYYRVENDIDKATRAYEQALACERLDPRLFVELDQLYELGNAAPQRRLEVLEARPEIIARREESLLRKIKVLVLTGDYRQAIAHLRDNFFHAQEGRDEIHDVYVDAHLLEGLRLLDSEQPAAALTHFQLASEYPENLSVGRPKDDPRVPQIACHTGLAYEALGAGDEAVKAYRTAVQQAEVRRRPEARYYQAMSHVRLGQPEQARTLLDQLVESGERQLAQPASTDFFAKFGQQATQRSRNASAHYLIGLGRLGMGARAEALSAFGQAYELNLSYPWARYYRDASQRGAVPAADSPPR